MSDEPKNLCAAGHCWHSASFVHAVHVPGGSHRDEHCCHCPAIRCYNEFPKGAGGTAGHGPFASAG